MRDLSGGARAENDALSLGNPMLGATPQQYVVLENWGAMEISEGTPNQLDIPPIT